MASGDGSSSRHRFGKGPVISEVLYQQDSHRSRHIKVQDGRLAAKPKEVITFQAGKVWKLYPWTQRIVDEAGFGHAGRVSAIRLNCSLLQALVERWRPESHSFHLPKGEMTITLLDVQVILGLPIDGSPVTDSYRPNATGSQAELLALCEQLLGRRPDFRNQRDGRNTEVTIKWLKTHFWKKSDAQDFAATTEEMAQQRARAYILLLLGTSLFANRGDKYVPLEYLYFLQDWERTRGYSWASAILAWTYRGLCTAALDNKSRINIAVCGPLLQVWCWEHIGIGKPSITIAPTAGKTVGEWWAVPKTTTETPVPHNVFWYRDELVGLLEEGMVYNPWTDVRKNLLPNVCLQHRDLALIRLPLIHFNIVEYYVPSRVYRQFDLPQPIPEAPADRSTWNNHHSRHVKWTKTPDLFWFHQHAQAIQEWENRFQVDIPNPEGVSYDEWLDWYVPRTVSFVDPDPPVPSVQENADYYPTPGHFGTHGNTVQLLMMSCKKALKKVKKLGKNLAGRMKKDNEDAIEHLREMFETACDMHSYEAIMAGEDSPNSEDDINPNSEDDINLSDFNFTVSPDMDCFEPSQAPEATQHTQPTQEAIPQESDRNVRRRVSGDYPRGLGCRTRGGGSRSRGV